MQHEQYQKQLQVIRKRTIKKLHPAFRESFSKDMIWQNKNYKIKIFIPKNTVKIPLDLLRNLKETLEEYPPPPKKINLDNFYQNRVQIY